MPKQDYLPTTQADYLAWHAQFVSRLNELKNTYAIPAEKLLALETEQTGLAEKLAMALTRKAEAKAATATLTAALRDSQGGIRQLARQLKAHAAYTAADGAALGIIGPDDAGDPALARPTLSVRELGEGRVELDFARRGYTGVRIYGRRGGEAGLMFLAVDTDPPYVDTRPLLAAGQPETREYQARYLDGDDETGQPSDIVKAVARP